MPRSSGEREALRALMAAREGAVNAKTRRAQPAPRLLVTTPEPLRGELRPLTRAPLLHRLAATRPESRRDPELRGTLLALRTVARRVLQLTTEERQLAREIEKLVRKPRSSAARPARRRCAVCRPGSALVVPPGPPPERGRVRAARRHRTDPSVLGQTIRYRLDRGGDRKLNRTLHLILNTRKRTHRPTIDYIERRISEGKTRREATRCLKRYLARNLYRLLENPPATT